MTQPAHVVVFYTVAGGGHVAAANALKQILEATGRYRVSLVNPYVDLMPHLDMWARLTGRASEDIYNQSVIGEGKTGLYCLTYYAGILLNFRLAYGRGRRILAEYFEQQKPDMVISVLPMLNRIIFDALQDYRDQAPQRAKTKGAVLITDWTEYGRHIWFPKGRDYTAICGTEAAARRAEAYRNLAGRVMRTQGLLLKPSFQGGPPPDKKAAKSALGLDPERPVICMMYGAQGSRRMLELADSLRQDPPDGQFLFLCGRNQGLAAEMQAMNWPFPTRIMGFTDQVPLYFGASDIFVGKPGPGSVSEAVSYGLFLLLDKSMALPQEAPVLKWLKTTGSGTAFGGKGDFRRGVAGLIGHLRSGGAAPQAVANTASAEIAAIVDTILATGG